ncbi:MAG: hypothetical protein M3R27_16115 [Bacteroidota bacterium]|nr:hypothetical protein [Bacteroidota bacterium]
MSQVIKTKNATIILEDSGLLRVQPVAEAEIDLEEVMACFEVYRKMGIGPHNKVLQLMEPGGDLNMNKEAREYVAVHGKDFFRAAAVISNSLAVRLIVNFFVIFNKKDSVPIKMFNTEKEAQEWLKQY